MEPPHTPLKILGLRDLRSRVLITFILKIIVVHNLRSWAFPFCFPFFALLKAFLLIFFFRIGIARNDLLSSIGLWES